jgi:hypothetical protein
MRLVENKHSLNYEFSNCFTWHFSAAEGKNMNIGRVSSTKKTTNELKIPLITKRDVDKLPFSPHTPLPSWKSFGIHHVTRMNYL